MGGLGAAVMDFLFPPSCSACGVVGLEPFCELCEDALLPAGPLQLQPLETARAVLLYGGPGALALHRLKYGREVSTARPLGALLAQAVSELPAYELVVPVPLALDRLVERGFNQVRELLRGFPGRVEPRLLLRTRRTRPQVRLSALDRVSNVRGAFEAREGIRGRRVLLVDDVLTTGATLAAAAEALRVAGAREVHGLCLFRADQLGVGA